ncbi:MAG: hypothetical protein RMJ53_07310, partial [Chitinophagales bacterium]|nr:hypothetical protein [Chitinophagales bacterium]
LSFNANGTLNLQTNFPDNFTTTSAAWLTQGNSGTTPTTNFLGTTDNQALSIRTNNTEAIRITTAGDVGIGTAVPARKLHIAGNPSTNPGSGTGTVTIYNPTLRINGLNATNTGFPVASYPRPIGVDANGDVTFTSVPSIYSVTGTTDISMNSTTFTSTGLSLTFTAKTNNALVLLTMSGRSDPSTGSVQQNVWARVLLNGTSIGGTVAVGADYDDLTGVTTGWNLSFSRPINVTPGSTYTLTVEWRRTGNITRTIFCEPVTLPDAAHRTLTVIEY